MNRKVLLAVAGVALLVLLVGCGAAGLVVAGLLGVTPAPLQAVVGKSRSAWRFQDLEDHFNRQGFGWGRVSHPSDPNSMYFGDGTEMKDGTVAVALEARHPRDFGPGPPVVLVTDCGTEAAAAERSASLNDRQDGPALAWGKYLFRSNDATLAKVRAALP